MHTCHQAWTRCYALYSVCSTALQDGSHVVFVIPLCHIKLYKIDISIQTTIAEWDIRRHLSHYIVRHYEILHCVTYLFGSCVYIVAKCLNHFASQRRLDTLTDLHRTPCHVRLANIVSGDGSQSAFLYLPCCMH